MSADIADALSSKLRSHPEFWSEFHALQVMGVRASLPAWHEAKSQEPGSTSPLLARLLYCASIFSQANNEADKSLAQTIALNALLAAPNESVRAGTEAILCNLGNFPGLSYVQKRYGEEKSSLLNHLRINLLRKLNAVAVADAEVSLTDFQYGLWHSLSKPETTSISAPTSAGKSFLVLEHLYQRVVASTATTIVYIAPTRALLSEIHRKLSARFRDHADTRISTVPGLDAEGRPKQVFILTQERLHVLLATADLSADMVIVDEAQSLSDGARGMILQDCLERVRALNPSAKVVFLSPGAEGFTEVASYLGIDSISVRETSLSPVLQNRIQVRAVPGSAHALNLAVLSAAGPIDVGTITTSRGIENPRTRLVATALELGGDGAALIYATGPVAAEETAKQLISDLPSLEQATLVELSEFIKEHIHPQYGLAEMVLHGVAFHYGKMPTLLREALEAAFRRGDIKYLVCTTTLFQGVNLPARSVFINTPTRGRGVQLDPAHLWNFAGRAGRLGEDIVGNVFLVDYDQWPSKDLDERIRYKVKPALTEIISSHYDEVLQALEDPESRKRSSDETALRVSAAAGLMMARAYGPAETYLDRVEGISKAKKAQLLGAAKYAAQELHLPQSIIENNWTVDLFGLQRLAARMHEKIQANEIDDLIPVHPGEASAYNRYTKIFGRIAREVLRYDRAGVGRYGGFVATYAVPWMKGMPYPVMLAKWVGFHSKKSTKSTVNDHIRKGFDFFEDTLRFQMVQLGKAYIDVLDFVLSSTGHESRRAEVFDYALALELGVSSKTGRAFVELGMSRIAAVALENLFPNSELTATQAREKLTSLNLRAIALSPIIVTELRSLGLVTSSQI